MASTQPTLLVTGASGHLGRRVVEYLLDTGAGPVIATTRNPDQIADLADRGVTVRRADHADPATLPAAFAGADRLLLISGSDLVARLDQHRAAIDAAIAAGVSHIAYASVTAPRPDPENPLFDSHYWTEQALAASPIGWTALRNCIYTDMILMSLPRALETGQLFSATNGMGRNYVTRDDCARTAAAALADGFDGRRILDVTGPAPVTQDEIAAMASALSERPVAHLALSPEALAEGLAGAGVPPAAVAGLVGFDLDAAQGYHAITTPTVAAMTGVQPTTVSTFLAANRQVLQPAA